MTNSGRLTFGVYPDATRTITSPAACHDDTWHLAGWPNAPTTLAWAGSMYDAAVMTNALTPAQVAQLYRAGT